MYCQNRSLNSFLFLSKKRMRICSNAESRNLPERLQTMIEQVDLIYHQSFCFSFENSPFIRALQRNDAGEPDTSLMLTLLNNRVIRKDWLNKRINQIGIETSENISSATSFQLKYSWNVEVQKLPRLIPYLQLDRGRSNYLVEISSSTLITTFRRVIVFPSTRILRLAREIQLWKVLHRRVTRRLSDERPRIRASQRWRTSAISLTAPLILGASCCTISHRYYDINWHGNQTMLPIVHGSWWLTASRATPRHAEYK